MAIIGLMMILVLFAIGRVNTVAYINGKTGISPIPSSFSLDAELFYRNDNFMLEGEKRKLTIRENNIVVAVINGLKQQPENQELRPVIDPGVRILSSEIIDKKLYLDLSVELTNSSLWSMGYSDVVIYSIVNTLTQFDTIERVQLKIDSKDIGAFIANTPTVSEYSYNNQIIYRAPQSPRDVVETFLNYAMIERYDLAYQMTTAYSALEMNDSGFVQYMRSYRASKLSYVISDIVVSETEEGIKVNVYYGYFDAVRKISFDGGFEIWDLEASEDGYYRIRWRNN